ncbi:MAG: hypothetical protein F4052_00345 [Dehalococcoidia bacterium]|nr:hypothetical protein [Dehalococcoidia bacterium]MYK25402.1 hypothetical protein [Dehalococcoidia bacterium]
MESSDSILLDSPGTCERCGLPGEPVMIHSSINGMTAGHIEETGDTEFPQVWLPGQERILCDGCFDASYDHMVEIMGMMSRGELPYPLDDAHNL